MPITGKKVTNLNLAAATPSALNVETLKTQLNGIGLACKDTSTPRLSGFVDDVLAQVQAQEQALGKPSSVQAFSIKKPATDPANRLAGFVQDFESAATGNWTSKDIGYGQQLEYIQFGTHFDWLKTQTGFTGITNHGVTTEIDSTSDAIKLFFVNTTTTASSVVLNGLSKDTLIAVMSNAISPLNDTSIKNYDKTDSRVIFLVDNYNPSTNSADSIGVVTIKWHLTITDYKEKKATNHQAVLEVWAWAVQYSDLDEMNRDVNLVKAQFGPKAFNLAAAIPGQKNTVTIYQDQPPASADTFLHSVPLASTTGYLDHLVMFAPDLQIIGSVDNTKSSVTTSYSKSVTTGFLFSSTQSLGIEVGIEAGIGVVKGSLKVSFSISFTEQYSTETTETIDFSVPAGQKAFLYQGTLISRILRYDPDKDTYTFMELGRFKSNIFAATGDPVDVGATVSLVAL